MGRVLVRSIVVLAVVMMIVPAGFLFAEDLDLHVDSRDKGLIGLGVGFAPDYEGSDDYEGVPLLRFKYQWDNGMNINLFGNAIRLDLVGDEKWGFGPVLRYRAERDSVDSEQVSRMNKVSAAGELGLFGSVKIEKWLFMVTGAADVTDSYDGYLFELKGAYIHPFNKQTGSIWWAGTSYADSDYMDTYFSVNPGNKGTSTLPNFKADSEFKDVEFGLAVTHNVSEKWQLVFLGQYTNLLGDAADSPVTDIEGSSGQFLGGINASYRF